VLTQAFQFDVSPEDMFGRAGDMAFLRDRVTRKGLTVLLGNPRIGKSWLLQRLCALLSDSRDFVVGYALCTGEESQLLLHATMDMYRRWLGDSTWREQAGVLWRQAKRGNLVKCFGESLARIMDPLFDAGLAAANPPAAVLNGILKHLLRANDDFITASVQLPSLSYEQARDLCQVVAMATGKPIVLVLDAWEKSGYLEKDAGILETFLDCHADWPDVHVLAAIRKGSGADDVVRGLKCFHLAASREVESMDLRNPAECDRMLAVVRARLPFTEDVRAKRLLGLVAGNPAVLDSWFLASNLRTEERLAALAENAHANLYPELAALPDLPSPRRNVAVRLALIGQIGSRAEWSALRDVILSDISDEVIVDLQTQGLLDRRYDFPTYGHDTRHQAARRRLLENAPLMLLQEEAEGVIVRLARAHAAAPNATPLYIMKLIVLGVAARFLGVSGAYRAIGTAAALVVQGIALEQEELDLFSRYGPEASSACAGTAPLLAQAFISRGSTRHQAGDTAGAIADFAAALAMPDAPSRLKAFAFVGRGVAKALAGDWPGAVIDHNAALATPDIPDDLKAHVLATRAFAKLLARDTQGAIADCTAALSLPSAPAEQKPLVLCVRSIAKRQAGDIHGSIDDCEAVLGMPDASAEAKARARVNRGDAKAKAGDAAGAIDDYNAVLAAPDVPDDVKASARISLGEARGQAGNTSAVIADCVAAIAVTKAPDTMKTAALGGAARACYSGGQFCEAAELARQALTLRPGEDWIRANLAIALLRLGKAEEAIAEYARVAAGATDAAELDRIARCDLLDAMKDVPDLPGACEALEILDRRIVELQRPT
jgi:tetratricopeptide (TPR) repeat protein